MLALTAQPIATARRVGISIHLLNKVVSPKAKNINKTNNAKPIGEVLYTIIRDGKLFFKQTMINESHIEIDNYPTIAHFL